MAWLKNTITPPNDRSRHKHPRPHFRRRRSRADESGGCVVVLETLWTLRRAYHFDDDRLVIVLRKLTEHPALVCGHKDLMRDAAHRTKEEGGDVADNLIALMNQSEGCATTYTFDREAALNDGFTLLNA